MTVPSGKKVANLLLRFYDIESGKIFIEGQDISHISRKSLRNDIAIVLQDTVLFSDTIRKNLQYAKESATQEQLDQAVEMSRSKDMIASLPYDYDTMLEAGGTNISQGQRQLLPTGSALFEILI